MRRLLILLVVAAGAVAQSDADRAELQAQFRRLDADKDGGIARKEFPGSDRQFEAMDADGNGKATLAEYLASAVARAFLRARLRERGEPRPRTALEGLAVARHDAAMRADRNQDGRIERGEWTGTADAFATLDLDANGVLDRRDRQEAAAQAPAGRPPLPTLRELPGTAELLAALDQDADGRIDGKEAKAHKQLPAAFPFADTDGDQALDRTELDGLLAALAARAAAQAGRERRPQAFEVPFAEWDTDKDGKVQQSEWQTSRTLFERIDLDRDAAVTRLEALRYEKRVEGADFIARFDLDGDGKVTMAEFAGPRAAFERADRNGDGVISRAERN